MDQAIANELDGLHALSLNAGLDKDTLTTSSDLLTLNVGAAASLKGFTLSESAAKTFAAALSGQSDCDGNNIYKKRVIPS